MGLIHNNTTFWKYFWTTYSDCFQYEIVNYHALFIVKCSSSFFRTLCVGFVSLCISVLVNCSASILFCYMTVCWPLTSWT